MARKHEHDPHKWKTAGDVLDTARVRGAHVGSSKDGEWATISTPQGTMKITPNERQELDKLSLSNIRRWFKLLGLMVLVATIIYLFW